MVTAAPEIRALIVDPSTHMAGLVALLLRTAGVRASDEAPDLGRAAAFLSRRPYGLMLLDAELGAAEKFRPIRDLRQNAGHPNRLLPVVLMATAPDQWLVSEAFGAGVTDILRKPFSANDVQRCLDGLRPAIERRTA